MPEKDPMSYAMITYVWVIGLSVWAGLSSYIRKIKQGYTRFSISELVGEICISGFIGVLTFFLCEASNISPILSAALIGISAHMSSRSMLMLENIFESVAKRWINNND